jgi:tetratricopeptide (TPR) repeat protein
MRMVKYFIFSVAVVILVAANIMADQDELFFRANKEYSDGNYQMAVELYEEIVSQGIENGNLFYNLGNAYFRLGQRGRSLLNYERARKYIPHDEDLFINYSFLKTVLNVEQIEDAYPLYDKLYFAVRDFLTTKLWFINTMLLFLLINVIIGILFFRYSFRKKVYRLLFVVCFLFIGSLFFFVESYKYHHKTKMGIIVVPKVEARYSPSYSGVVGFELVEGMKTQIIRKDGQWCQIRLNRKNSGWIEADTIEKI